MRKDKYLMFINTVHNNKHLTSPS